MSESPIAITDFNVVAATFGGFAALYALGSDFVTERLYLSEPSTLAPWGIGDLSVY